MTGLVWKGNIIKKLPTDCPDGDFECMFECYHFKLRLLVCSKLFVERNGNDVYIPMKFWHGEGSDRKLYDPATEDTPLSHLETSTMKQLFQMVIDE